MDLERLFDEWCELEKVPKPPRVRQGRQWCIVCDGILIAVVGRIGENCFLYYAASGQLWIRNDVSLLFNLDPHLQKDFTKDHDVNLASYFVL